MVKEEDAEFHGGLRHLDGEMADQTWQGLG